MKVDARIVVAQPGVGLVLVAIHHFKVRARAKAQTRAEMTAEGERDIEIAAVDLGIRITMKTCTGFDEYRQVAGEFALQA